MDDIKFNWDNSEIIYISGFLLPTDKDELENFKGFGIEYCSFNENNQNEE